MDTDPPIPIPTPLTKIKAQIIKSRYTDLQQLKTSALEHGETPNSSNTSQSLTPRTCSSTSFFWGTATKQPPISDSSPQKRLSLHAQKHKLTPRD
jgi:hypothetical protein